MRGEDSSENKKTTRASSEELAVGRFFLWDRANALCPFQNKFQCPVTTQIPMASIGDSRLCRCYTLMTFTPLYPIYPTQFDIRQTGFDKIPLLLCGIRHKMISAERSAAFDRCGGICYNENTKGNTADRRSALRNWFLKK